MAEFLFCFCFLKHALFKHGLMTHLKGNKTEGASGPENRQIVSSAGLIIYHYQLYIYIFIYF